MFTSCIWHQTFTSADHQGSSRILVNYSAPAEGVLLFRWSLDFQIFLSMSCRCVLWLSVFLVGLWQQATCATLPGRPSAPPEGAGVPAPHLRMLSLGLNHLLQGVKEHSSSLEKRGQQGALQLEQATKHVEELSKQSLQTGRTHRQVGRKKYQRLRSMSLPSR